MKVDREVVETVADLSKLKLEEPDIAEYIESMSRILDLVEEMQEVDTSNVSPMAHPLDTTQRMRADIVTEQNLRDEYQAMAPETAGGFYLVPRVVE
ncbi:MAG: Asp-tRNA(Asn)/Glu-tRNA(Gln) amidotransferase subunit GatC [Pseudomonadales bacterium]